MEKEKEKLTVESVKNFEAEVDYTTVLENFEGPLDLLLHLIKANKLDIYDIPIFELTQEEGILSECIFHIP